MLQVKIFHFSRQSTRPRQTRATVTQQKQQRRKQMTEHTGSATSQQIAAFIAALGVTIVYNQNMYIQPATPFRLTPAELCRAGRKFYRFIIPASRIRSLIHSIFYLHSSDALSSFISSFISDIHTGVNKHQGLSTALYSLR
jgi:hypothetical protein